MDYNQRYAIETKINQDEIIQILRVEFQSKIDELSRWMINTRDEQVREALIKLGWTPPKENNESNF